MIKNEANRVIKMQTNDSTVRQKASIIVNDNDNNRRTPSPQPNHHQLNNDEFQPLSKLDIIKKFDNKLKKTESSSEQQLAKHKIQSTTKTNDMEQHNKNDNNGIASKSGDNIYASQTDGILVRHKNDNENGNQCGNAIPPKPLPRTSRNNSISSLSSEHGNIDDSNGSRPVAKPRTTASSYKVSNFPKINLNCIFFHICIFIYFQFTVYIYIGLNCIRIS